MKVESLIVKPTKVMYNNSVFKTLESYIPDVKITIQHTLMAYTISQQLTHNNIVLRALNTEFFDLTLELFPAAKYRHTGKEHVNIFASGKVIITGVRVLDHIPQLIHSIEECL